MFARIVLTVALIAAFVAAVWWFELADRDERRVGDGELAPVAAEPPEPRHPLPESITQIDPRAGERPDERVPDDDERAEESPPGPLPALEDSDAYLVELLEALLGTDRIADWLVSERIAERSVVFINSLDSTPVPVEHRPVVPVPGRPQVAQDNEEERWSEANFPRYEPLIELLISISPAEAASLYVNHYPLLQEAHAALAPETDYFNDRLVDIIDHLFDPPRAGDAEFVLERYEAAYRFADETLEEASAGHKILMRIGPEHAEAVNDWLMRFRAAITNS